MIVNKKYLENAEAIKPYKDSSKLHGVSKGQSLIGYDVSIAETIIYKPGFLNLFPSITVIDADGKKTVHKRTRFILASTVEKFSMPYHLSSFLHDKSTWIREGILVGNSAIEPGWKGYLTLELFFFGTKKITIHKHSGIGQMVFHDLSENACYEGKYQNQQAGAVKAKFE